MARHRLKGKASRLPRDLRGRAQHRAMAYTRELLASKVALWLALQLFVLLTPPRQGGKL